LWPRIDDTASLRASRKGMDYGSDNEKDLLYLRTDWTEVSD
jgi:hypothetical protein